MSTGPSSQSSVEDVLHEIEAETSLLLELFQGSSKSGQSVEMPYFLLLGVFKRVMSISRGFVDLTRSTNFLCAAVLVRLQLDCSLRFHGVLLTPDPNQAVHDLLGGARIDKMRDSSGELLRDWYLAKKLTERFPWVQRIYDQSSAYVHLSTTHMFAPVHKTTEDGEVLFLLTEKDVCAPQEKWLEMVIAFREVTRLFTTTAREWLERESSKPPEAGTDPSVDDSQP